MVRKVSETNGFVSYAAPYSLTNLDQTDMQVPTVALL
jgi:hypothetical protein